MILVYMLMIGTLTLIATINGAVFHKATAKIVKRTEISQQNDRKQLFLTHFFFIVKTA